MNDIGSSRTGKPDVEEKSPDAKSAFTDSRGESTELALNKETFKDLTIIEIMLDIHASLLASLAVCLILYYNFFGLLISIFLMNQ